MPGSPWKEMLNMDCLLSIKLLFPLTSSVAFIAISVFDFDFIPFPFYGGQMSNFQVAFSTCIVSRSSHMTKDSKTLIMNNRCFQFDVPMATGTCSSPYKHPES